MSTKSEEKVEELQALLDTVEVKGIENETQIKELTRMTTYRLSDAIRSGSQVSEKAVGWGDGDSMCAMHAAVVDAHARGYMS